METITLSKLKLGEFLAQRKEPRWSKKGSTWVLTNAMGVQCASISLLLINRFVFVATVCEKSGVGGKILYGNSLSQTQEAVINHLGYKNLVWGPTPREKK